MIFIWHNYFLSGIIVFLSFFYIFWATLRIFVNENIQLFPKLSNFVSTLLCLSIYNKRVKDLFRVIRALKNFAILNSLNTCITIIVPDSHYAQWESGTIIVIQMLHQMRPFCRHSFIIIIIIVVVVIVIVFSTSKTAIFLVRK